MTGAFVRFGKRRFRHIVTAKEAIEMTPEQLQDRIEKCMKYEAYMSETCDCEDVIPISEN